MSIIPTALPVDSGDRTASSHAQYLRDLQAAVEALQRVVTGLRGGQDGILMAGDSPSDALEVTATSPVSMAVVVAAGEASISRRPYWLREAAETAAITAPVSNPRIDVVEAALDGHTVAVVTGTEAASPVAPTVDEDCLLLATIYCRVGMASVKGTDDSVNGYITDGRVYL